MKIRTLIFAVAATTAVVAPAQIFEKYEGLRYTHTTEDGRFIVDGFSGVKILDRQNNKQYRYGSDYSVGEGNFVSDDGIIVGSCNNFSQPCYWKNGSWINLDIPANATYARADAITPDGNTIVGTVDARSITGKQWPMTHPVIWEKDASGNYSKMAILPYPEKDITLCAPQQLSVAYISEDGKTAIGRLTDNRGFVNYQIVFHREDNGEWSYQTTGSEYLMKENSEWPPHPSRPVKPDINNYMTNEEVDNYYKGMQAYEDSLEIQGLTGIRPKYPYPQDYLKEHKEEYDEAMKKFNDDNLSYSTDLQKFFDAYSENMTGYTFDFNSIVMSRNGKYYSADFEYWNIFFEPDAEFDKNKYMSPMLFSNDNEFPPSLIIQRDLSAYKITDDGTIFANSPSDIGTLYTRKGYVIPKLEKEPVLFTDWMKENRPELYKVMDENLRFSYNDNNDALIEDELFSGTVRTNSDASIFTGYYLNPNTNEYESYYIQEGEPPVGISDINDEALITIDGRNISAPGCRIEVYNIAGVCVFTTEDNASLDHLANGIYIVNVTAPGARPRTQKIIL